MLSLIFLGLPCPHFNLDLIRKDTTYAEPQGVGMEEHLSQT